MTRNQIQQMVDELAEDLRAHVFQALGAEIWINGDEAGRVAGAIEHEFRHELDNPFDNHQPANGRPIRSRKTAGAGRRDGAASAEDLAESQAQDRVEGCVTGVGVGMNVAAIAGAGQ